MADVYCSPAQRHFFFFNIPEIVVKSAFVFFKIFLNDIFVLFLSKILIKLFGMCLWAETPLTPGLKNDNQFMDNDIKYMFKFYV